MQWTEADLKRLLDTPLDRVIRVYVRLALAEWNERGIRLTDEDVRDLVLGDAGVQQAIWTAIEEANDDTELVIQYRKGTHQELVSETYKASNLVNPQNLRAGHNQKGHRVVVQTEAEAVAYAQSLLEAFNQTRHPHDEPRSFVSAKLVKPSRKG